MRCLYLFWKMHMNEPAINTQIPPPEVKVAKIANVMDQNKFSFDRKWIASNTKNKTHRLLSDPIAI